MRDIFILTVHLLTTIAKLLGKGGARSIVADSLLMKQQLMITRRHQRRSPRLTPLDRFLLGFWSLFLNSRQIAHAAVIVRPSTLLKFHALLRKRKYRRLYSSNNKGKPGPKGPSKEIIEAVIALKRRNPSFGFLRIAQQINNTFGTAINKDVVRRILNDYTSDNEGNSPSWLSLLGHTKDSLWSTDLFRCESILLQTHWVLVVMDQYTRCIIGFGIQSGDVDGVTLCCMFNCAISNQGVPRYLSSDNDPLFRYHRWKANLRILEVAEIKSIPYTPTSHPFIERLIGTIRREYLDRLFFWNAQDLERKLESFAQYYNQHRVHQSLDGKTPVSANDSVYSQRANLAHYAWKSHCHGLFKTQIAA
jgi:putative transposase